MSDQPLHGKDKFDADRKRFYADAAEADDGGWTKHTQWHWSRQLAGSRLDYWPSRKKWMYLGRVQRGDVQAFINKHRSPVDLVSIDYEAQELLVIADTVQQDDNQPPWE